MSEHAAEDDAADFDFGKPTCACLRGTECETHPAESVAPACECDWTDPSTWLSAAACGYGGGYEPGSQMEWNPDCPAHPPTAPEDRPCYPAVGQAAHDRNGRLDRSICGLCGDAYAECSKCGVYLCDCTRTGTCAKGESGGVG